MENLATNKEKTALVRFLIEYARDKNIENRRVTTYLSKKPNQYTHSLSDFRVRSRPSNEAGLAKILENFHHLKTK